jgi:hypothetical protein
VECSSSFSSSSSSSKLNTKTEDEDENDDEDDSTASPEFNHTLGEETWISQNDTDGSGVKEGVGKRPTFNIQLSTSKEERVGKMRVVRGVRMLIVE